MVGALFSKMWEHEDMRLFTGSYKTLDLVASTVVTVYNHASKSAGLYSGMVRCQYPDLRIRIVHDAEAPPKPFGSSKEFRPAEERNLHQPLVQVTSHCTIADTVTAFTQSLLLALVCIGQVSLAIRDPPTCQKYGRSR